SLFAWRLARALGARSGLALVASGFALVAPVYLFRFPMHLALSGQWTLLLALWLYARPLPPRRWMWPLVACLVAMIHAYLLAMVLAIWVADLARRRWAGSLGWSGVAAEIAVVLVPTALVLWAVGFFMTGSLGIGGYGVYRLNLLGFVIPFDWSRLVPPIPAGRGDYEGMAFLGIGVLALLLVAIASGALPRLRRLGSHRWLPLLVVVVLMFGYALSDHIAIGGRELFTVPLPSVFRHFAADFRSSGRFVWPAVYLLTVGAVVALGWRLRPALAVGIAVVALAAQFVDAAPSELRFHKTLPAPSAVWSTPLASPFWDRAAAAGFTRLRAIPYEAIFGDWRALSYFAVTHGMATDAAYLGRTDGRAEHALAAREAGELATGTLEAGTLYEVGHAATLATAARLRPGDLLAWIDGRFIFARDGAALLDGLNIWARYGAQPPAAAAH
ncbi:MAG TPA: DUF6311 domain-containing protein, partial [Devosia sp.]|nr:DUF6311 domain-containing protein [Devosia sp.]